MAISITKPSIGGNEDTWGSVLNDQLTAVESTLNGSGTGKATVSPDLSTLTINSTNVTATAAELNLLDGATAATATTVAGTDRVVLNDSGTMKQVAMTDIETYVSSQGTTVNNSTITFTAGDDLSGGGAIDLNQSSNETITISHGNTSSLSGATSNSGSTYIQNITVDDNGHVTLIDSTDASANVGGIALNDVSSGDVFNNVTSQSLTAGTYLVRMRTSSSAASSVSLDLPTTNVQAGWGNAYGETGNNSNLVAGTSQKQVAFNGTAWVDHTNTTVTSLEAGSNHTSSGGSIELWIKLDGTVTINATSSTNNKLLIVKTG